jgi:hypothetical protein
MKSIFENEGCDKCADVDEKLQELGRTRDSIADAAINGSISTTERHIFAIARAARDEHTAFHDSRGFAGVHALR